MDLKIPKLSFIKKIYVFYEEIRAEMVDEDFIIVNSKSKINKY